MDGPEIAKFALEVLPPMIERVLENARWARDDVEIYLMHQATFFLLDHLRTRLELTEAQMPLALNDYGNTVCSTLPILMHDLRGRPPAARRRRCSLALVWGSPGPAARGPRPGCRKKPRLRPCSRA